MERDAVDPEAMLDRAQERILAKFRQVGRYPSIPQRPRSMVNRTDFQSRHTLSKRRRRRN